MRNRSWDIAACWVERRKIMAKGKWQRANSKWFFEICRLPFANFHLKFSFPDFLLVTLFIASSLASSACHKKVAKVAADPLLSAYDTEPDWNDAQRIIALNYQQAQGKRVFYQKCIWCHADAT